eukprot:jgi/Orpsp1_1/1178287/evm.model.c7180000064718.1
MSFNITEEINRWRGDDNPLTSKVNLVPIKRVYKIKSHFASSKSLSLSPTLTAKKPPINPYVDTINRDYQKNIAKLMIGGYLNSENMNSEYNKKVVRTFDKTIDHWNQRQMNKPVLNNSTSTKKSNNNKFFVLDSPNVVKNLGGMMDDKETEVLLNNQKLQQHVKEMNDQYQDIVKKNKGKYPLKKKLDMKIKKRVQDRLIRKEDAPSKKECCNGNENKNNKDDENKKLESNDSFDFSCITKSSTDIHDIMEKYDYIKYLENKNEEKIFIPSQNSPNSTSELSGTNDTKTQKQDDPLNNSPNKANSAEIILNKSNNNNNENIPAVEFLSQSSVNNISPNIIKDSIPNKSNSSIKDIKSSNISVSSNSNIQNNSMAKTLIKEMDTHQKNGMIENKSSIPQDQNSKENGNNNKINNNDNDVSKNINKDIENNINNGGENTTMNTTQHEINSSHVDIYKPSLPVFKSKIYNNKDISFQEKMLSLENSKKFKVNENSQKFKNFYKNDKTEKFQNYINKELSILKLKKDDENADLRRLEIYSHCMDMICEEFPIYGSILSEIKNEYDKIINNIKVDQNEIHFLRLKIQKLLAQNENRLLLKYETQKNKELESQLDDLL